MRPALRWVCAAWLWCALAGQGATVQAHEYWIDPIAARVPVGSTLLADIRNGEEFVGSSFPFDDSGYQRFYFWHKGARTPVSGRLGDYPALHQEMQQPGLHTVILETRERTLVYPTMERFRAFLAYHGLSAVEQVHTQRGLPSSNIQERYFRFAKALVHVDDPSVAGAARRGSAADVSPDRSSATDAESLAARVQREGLAGPQGLLFELIALNDPTLQDESRFVVLFQQSPIRQAQVEVFHRTPDGAVSRSIYRSDERGVATIATHAPGEYLVNSVQVIQPRSGSAHWESLWASTTFEKPAGAASTD